MAATLNDIFSIRFSSSEVLNRTAAACMKAAADIKNESVGTANHVARVLWADLALADPMQAGRQMVVELALNPKVQVDFREGSESNGVSDDDIIYVVASNIDKYATGA